MKTVNIKLSGVWWPNVIIVKYVRFCEEIIKNRKKQKNISDKSRKKVPTKIIK